MVSAMLRVQFKVFKTVLDLFEKYQKLGGLYSIKELVMTAFTILMWAVRERARGNKIGYITPAGKIVEYDLPYISIAAQALGKEANEEGSNL